MLTYAIGDIHGHMALLAKLLNMIHTDAGGAPHRLIFLGDYVDRGPESFNVVQTIRKLKKQDPDNVIAIMGNHEDMMVTAFRALRTDNDQIIHDNRAMINVWLSNGGKETLAEYLNHDPVDIDTHIAWLDMLPTSFQTEYHFFCHAGITPARPLFAQPDHILLWTRDWWCHPATGEGYTFDKHIVYGHTPTRDGLPRAYDGSTGLDTGSFFAGVLTAGVFDTSQPGGPLRFLQARRTA